MKKFREYLRENGVDLDANFHGRGLGSGDGKQDPDGLMDILRDAVGEHYEDILEMLRQLGRKDPRIQDKLDNLNRTALNNPKPFGKDKLPKTSFGHEGGDEVMPNQADRADGGGGVFGQGN